MIGLAMANRAGRSGITQTKDSVRAGATGIPAEAVTLLVLPLIVYYLYFCVGFNDGAMLPWSHANWGGFFAAIVPTGSAAVAYLTWIVLQAALFVILPGRVVTGLPLQDGSRLTYRLNGLAAFVISLLVLAAGHLSGLFRLTWIYENFGALLSVITIFSIAFAFFTYYWGLRHPDTPPRLTGNFLPDYFLGTALNPRVPPVTGFDLKFFFESRPGLIGWVVVDAALAIAQMERHGGLSLSMELVVTLQFLYVAGYFWSEQNVLSMIDIRTENFGWMLVYGDAALVPMTYSLQAFYLIDHVPSLPSWIVAAGVALFVAGFYIFRAANAQKNRFRYDPDNCRIWRRPAEYLTTARGTPLLVSGFWGWARHPNYLGDLLIAVAFSLPTLFGSLVPWFYPLWMTTLLLNRERRDDRWCEQKYGADWQRYRERVPSRIIPRLY
jgi:protein-S-isoprenylcysteine O-methyltransferase Ste14